MLMPKFLLLTTAVIQNATSPKVKPLVTKAIKSNQTNALDQNLMLRRSPPMQNEILMKITLMK